MAGTVETREPTGVRGEQQVSPVGASSLGVFLLLATLAFAIIRPRGLSEAAATVPAAAIALATGLISWPAAGETVGRLGSTIGFLAAVLVIAHLCDVAGVFRWLGAVMAVRSRADPARLLVLVFVVASLTTAALSLDATVILLTPAILATIKRLQVKPAPHVYAAAHLSNTASLVLPVSNFTNLLAFQASALTFLGFTGLMVGRWLAAIAVGCLMFHWFFGADLRAADRPTAPQISPVEAPRVTLTLLTVILAGFAAAPLLHAQPAVPDRRCRAGRRGSSPSSSGFNIGPNLTYTGSLATLLWRRVLLSQATSPSLGRFTRLGLLTVPTTLLAAVVVLWAGSLLQV